jgi:hypothetical protein
MRSVIAISLRFPNASWTSAFLPQLLEGVGDLLGELVVADREPAERLAKSATSSEPVLVCLEPLEQDLHRLNQFIRIIGTWLAPPPH